MLYYIVTFSYYGVFNLASIYIAILALVKFLESIKSMLCDLTVLIAYYKHPVPENPTSEEGLAMKEQREKYITFTIHLLQKIFLVSVGRSFFALIWGIANYIVAILMRPFFSNAFLFGANSTQWESAKFEFLDDLRKERKKKSLFGIMGVNPPK